jgi:hypothetical protein
LLPLIGWNEEKDSRSTWRSTQDQMSMSKMVADVLAKDTKRKKILQNVQILPKQLEEEKMANAKVQLVVNNQRGQIHVLSKQVHEVEQARVNNKEEMQKKQTKIDVKLDLLLSQLQSWTKKVRCLRKFMQSADGNFDIETFVILVVVNMVL